MFYSSSDPKLCRFISERNFSQGMNSLVDVYFMMSWKFTAHSEWVIETGILKSVDLQILEIHLSVGVATVSDGNRLIMRHAPVW